jgi:hypothetical protein
MLKILKSGFRGLLGNVVLLSKKKYNVIFIYGVVPNITIITNITTSIFDIKKKEERF